MNRSKFVFTFVGLLFCEISIVDGKSKPTVNQPELRSQTGTYGFEGGQLVLNCSVSRRRKNKGLIELVWTLPNDDIAKKVGRTNISRLQSNFKNHIIEQLIVNQLSPTNDTGVYKCTARSSSMKTSSKKRFIRVLGADDSFINMTETRHVGNIRVRRYKQEIKWNVEYSGYPDPEVVWRDIHGNEIPWTESENRTRKFEASKTDQTTILKIRNPTFLDSGTFTLMAHNERMEKKMEFQLLVEDLPYPEMRDISAKPNEKVAISCDIFGYPSSTVQWSFFPCDQPSFDSEMCTNTFVKKISFSNANGKSDSDHFETVQKSMFNQTSTLYFTPMTTGIVQCDAKNKFGLSSVDATVSVSDLDDEFIVEFGNRLPTGDVVVGDTVSIVCAVSVQKYMSDLDWFRGETVVESDDGIRMKLSTTMYSIRKEIHWDSITFEAAGTYECRATKIRDNQHEKKSLELRILEPMQPQIIESNIQNGVILEHLMTDPVQLQCKFDGKPYPRVTWYKDEKALKPDSNDTRIQFHDNDTQLDIRFLKAEDAGKYKCVEQNRIGSASEEAEIRFTNTSKINKPLIYGVSSFFSILVAVSVYIAYRNLRERKKLQLEFKAAGLANFEEGYMEGFNPALALDKQADLLPYDRRHEFSRDKLTMGKVIGKGAYGVVMKAIARGIINHEENTVVAVKMVNKLTNNEMVRSLTSELKIMVHLGKHLNVVNLLGAVTKNIAQRDLMIIVEFCKFGSLQNILIENRHEFIDQIIQSEDRIDPKIMTRNSGEYFQLRSESTSSYQFNYSSAEPKYQSVVNSLYVPFSNDAVVESAPEKSSEPPSTYLSLNDPRVCMQTYCKRIERNLPPVPSESEQSWSQSDNNDLKRSYTTSDLLCWSFQIARGMNYLASRKVLHGYLAARNILLCSDNVVKICDFGLARSLYKTDIYRKKGEDPLPLKWLAIESISDQIFTTYSDVWSFGILLWELFSLGRVPYPECNRILDSTVNYLMDTAWKNQNTQHKTCAEIFLIYDIMLSCWRLRPESRPLFDILEKNFYKLLESGVAQYYTDLNDPYLKANANYFNSGKVDYLALVESPNSQAPPAPNSLNFVNEEQPLSPIDSFELRTVYSHSTDDITVSDDE